MCRHVLIVHVAQGEYCIVQTLCLLFRGSQPSFCGYLPSFLSYLPFGEQTSELTVLPFAEGWVCCCRTLTRSADPFLSLVLSWRLEQVAELCAGAWYSKGSHMQVSCLELALSNNFSHFCTEKEA